MTRVSATNGPAHFSEEVIRGGPAFGLSLALTRLDKMLRRKPFKMEYPPKKKKFAVELNFTRRCVRL